MKLEEIKQLSDEELGRRLAESVGYDCLDGFYFIAGGKYPHPSDFETLCQSLDAVAEAELAVIERAGDGYYASALWNVLKVSGLTYEKVVVFATASARQRAEACLLALSENSIL